MKQISIFFIAVWLIANSLFSQDSIRSNKPIAIDTGLVYTRYTTIPIKNLSLKNIDKSLLGVRHVNEVYRIEEIFYQTLSTEGSPRKALTMLPNDISDISYQPNLYQGLRFTRENIKFFNVYKPYSELNYSNVLGSSRYFSVIHAQNIYKNLHIGLEYKVNYTTGMFDKSQVMNQFFNITARYKNKKETYEGYLAFIRNRAMQSESGGIKSDSSFREKEYSSLNAYPMNISSAYSKWKSKEFFLSQKFSFLKLLTDNKFLSSLSIIHDISYSNSARIYEDNNAYDGFYQSIYFDTIHTYDSLLTKKLTNSIALRNDYILPFTFGISHDYILFSDTLNKEASSLITPFFELGLDIKEFKLLFDYKHIISSSRYANDYQIGGKLIFKNLFSELRFANKSVDYFYTKYSANNFQWSNNNFDKIKTFNLNIGYKYKNILSLRLDYFSLYNMVYISSELVPKQYNHSISLYQATLLHNLKLWKIGFRGAISLQKLSNNDNALSLPLFQAKESIYIAFKLFKGKLNTEVGFDLRYNTSYYADRYIPSMNAFACQNDILIGNYLFTDFFMQANIDRASLFITLSHPYANLFGRNYYLTPHYPAETLNLRFGVCWRFFD